MHTSSLLHAVFFRMPDIMEHKLRTDIILADCDTHELFSDKMRFIFIELPSFDKEEEQCENDFERWIYVLTGLSAEEIVQL